MQHYAMSKTFGIKFSYYLNKQMTKHTNITRKFIHHDFIKNENNMPLDFLFLFFYKKTQTFNEK